MFGIFKRVKSLENKVEMLHILYDGQQKYLHQLEEVLSKTLIKAKQGKAISGLDVYETDALPKKKRGRPRKTK